MECSNPTNEKLPIAIVTFYDAINYGAALQAFALQTFLNSNLYKTKFLNFEKSRCQIVGQKETSSGGMISKLHKLLHIPSYIRMKKRCKSFSAFVNQKLVVSKFYARAELPSSKNDFLCFIAGSDQIWNPYITGDDVAYYLAFIEDSAMKKTYGASFGVSFDTLPNKNEIKHRLSTFSSLLLREKSASDAINCFTEINSKVVCDPSFLLSATEWRSHSSESSWNHRKPYLFLFLVSKGDCIVKKAFEYAKIHHLDIVSINGGGDVSIPKCVSADSASPFDLLKIIDNASCVFTTSFHGVALSMNLGKSFYCEVSSSTLGSRIIDLLKICDSANHLLSAGSDMKANAPVFDKTPLLSAYIDQSKKELLGSLKK
jgi:hypothetical protein